MEWPLLLAREKSATVQMCLTHVRAFYTTSKVFHCPKGSLGLGAEDKKWAPTLVVLGLFRLEPRLWPSFTLISNPKHVHARTRRTVIRFRRPQFPDRNSVILYGPAWCRGCMDVARPKNHELAPGTRHQSEPAYDVCATSSRWQLHSHWWTFVVKCPSPSGRQADGGL